MVANNYRLFLIAGFGEGSTLTLVDVHLDVPLPNPNRPQRSSPTAIFAHSDLR
jgi:hypothetical protein